MKMKQVCFLLLGATLAASSCRKSDVSTKDLQENDDSLLKVFQNSKIPENPVIDISGRGTSGGKKAGGGVIRDSVWANQLGKTYFVESDDITITSENADAAYPGAILNSKSIVQKYEFLPLGRAEYDALPIRASLSVPGTNVSGVIEYPGLGETREFVGKIMKNRGNVDQVNSFSYTSTQFTDYNELKYTFGANVDVGKIAGLSVSVDGTKIRNRTGIIARFVQENFTVDMSLPKKTELISIADANALQQEYAPTYVNSVTFGRLAVFIADTKADYDEFNAALKASVNFGLVSGSAQVTDAQKKLISEAKISIYMRFGDGKAFAESVLGYDKFIEAVKKGASVQADAYGGPISFRMRNLKNFGIFKTIFKVNVKN